MADAVWIAVQYLRYVACSACAALTNFTVGFALVQGAGFTSGLRYPLAIACGYASGMIVNFVLNRHFTFSGSDRTRLEQSRTFFVVAITGLVLTSVVASAARSLFDLVLPGTPLLGGSLAPLGTAETIGQVIAIGLVSIYSFAGHRYLTFNRGIRFQAHRLARLVSTKHANE
jgi:putative flippase GtrA